MGHWLKNIKSSGQPQGLRRVSVRFLRSNLSNGVKVSLDGFKSFNAALAQKRDVHPGLKRQRELLDSIPGIGPETAARLLAEMPQLGEFDSARAAAAHTGLTPKRHQSGSSINAPTRISKIGNPQVRYALYMPAMTALRSSKEFKEFAARLTERGKKKMQIIAAWTDHLVLAANWRKG